MIINKQQLDVLDNEGNPTKQLIISYVNKDGEISYLQWVLPKEEVFEWGYTYKKNADAPFYILDENGNIKIDEKTNTPMVARWMSYDNKYVRKNPTTRDLSETRLIELINKMSPEIQKELFATYAPQTWYCDIETDVDPTQGFSDPSDPFMPINTIAITKFPRTIVFSRKNLSKQEQENIQKRLDGYSDLTKGYKFEFKYFETEQEMLYAFIQFIVPIVAISGWNFLAYDWLYIYNRAERLGLDLSVISPTKSFFKFTLNRKVKADCKLPYHKIVFDYLQIYQMWDQSVKIKENDTLDWVANHVLGIRKVQHEWGFSEFYRDHFEEYVFYNAVDTILVEKIDEHIRTASIWQMMAAELKTDLYAAFSTIKPCEIVMADFLYNDYKVIVSKKNQNDIPDADYEGAFVWPTRGGVYKYIGGLDFKSLYPMTMAQFGISPEAFLFKDKNYKPASDEIKTSSGAVYKKDKNSCIPRIIKKYFAKRKEAKNDRKIADETYEYLHSIYKKRTSA